MPSEDMIIRMHEEYIEQVNESGMPIWLLDLYNCSPPIPDDSASSEDTSKDDPPDTLPF